MREMQGSDGGYYSSIDADSHGEEGRFYVWQREQALEQLSQPEFDAFAARYGLDERRTSSIAPGTCTSPGRWTRWQR